MIEAYSIIVGEAPIVVVIVVRGKYVRYFLGHMIVANVKDYNASLAGFSDPVFFYLADKAIDACVVEGSLDIGVFSVPGNVNYPLSLNLSCVQSVRLCKAEAAIGEHRERVHLKAASPHPREIGSRFRSFRLVCLFGLVGWWRWFVGVLCG